MEGVNNLIKMLVKMITQIIENLRALNLSEYILFKGSWQVYLPIYLCLLILILSYLLYMTYFYPYKRLNLWFVLIFIVLNYIIIYNILHIEPFNFYYKVSITVLIYYFGYMIEILYLIYFVSEIFFILEKYYLYFMWGGIYTEASYQLNFNTAFSTTRSDVLVHLSQWQYWWWFWFAFIWTFYYLVIAKVVRHRSLKMRPRIATSYRPHGKWGDFIAAIIPTIWCINIICNSNFILRLIEWQTESSLLTIRVRARQWYWVYKFDSKAVIDIFTTPKNIGRNKWTFHTLYDTKITDSYMDLLELRSQNEWLKDYWNNYIINESTDKKELINLPVDLKFNHFNDESNYSFLTFSNAQLSSVYSTNSIDSMLNNNNNFLENLEISNFVNLENTHIYNKISHIFDFNELNSDLNYRINIEDADSTIKEKVNSLFFNFIDNGQIGKDNSGFYINTLFHSNKVIDFVDNSRFLKRTQGLYSPLRLVKTLFLNDSDNELFKLQWGSGESTLKSKIKPYTTYLTLKQKRYKRKKIINFTSKNIIIDGKKIITKWKPMLVNNRFFLDSEIDPTVSYKMIKKLKKKDDILPLSLAKRLLRVKRTLVVPAHINLTVITSSYDIIHSWFIPGLGLKLDCVPGRSTHHTFYIDNVGFYFGQCAEICGRYHHHMPIRVCALPFDHFLTWWYHFGAPRLMFTNNAISYSFRKYSW